MRALLSVANRQGLAGLARDLLALGVEVYATDGTREHLAADGIDVLPVAALTNVPPLLGGMVKTLHPAVYAGILARRDRPEQLAELAEHAIGLIDLVVVNVAPFAPQVGERRVPLDEAIEMIDVGGTALLCRRCPQLRRGRRGPRTRRRTSRSWPRSAPGAASPPSSASAWPPRPSPSWPPTTPRSRPT